MQKFIGLANYYKRVIKDFAKIVKPLHRLVRKDKNRIGEQSKRRCLKS